MKAALLLRDFSLRRKSVLSFNVLWLHIEMTACFVMMVDEKPPVSIIHKHFQQSEARHFDEGEISKP
jgi:hypothetical protein